jgi:hypothetical protein
VFNLQGQELVDGWQPADLAARMRVREEFHSGTGWPNPFEFCRVHTPYPDVLKT